MISLNGQRVNFEDGMATISMILFNSSRSMSETYISCYEDLIRVDIGGYIVGIHYLENSSVDRVHKIFELFTSESIIESLTMNEINTIFFSIIVPFKDTPYYEMLVHYCVRYVVYTNSTSLGIKGMFIHPENDDGVLYTILLDVLIRVSDTITPTYELVEFLHKKRHLGLNHLIQFLDMCCDHMVLAKYLFLCYTGVDDIYGKLAEGISEVMAPAIDDGIDNVIKTDIISNEEKANIIMAVTQTYWTETIYNRIKDSDIYDYIKKDLKKHIIINGLPQGANENTENVFWVNANSPTQVHLTTKIQPIQSVKIGWSHMDHMQKRITFKDFIGEKNDN